MGGSLGNGLKLLFLAFVGYLFIMAAITGRPGSLLEAIILPAAMIPGPYPGVSTGCQGVNVPAARNAAASQLTPALLASVAAGTITQAQMQAVLAKIALSTPQTPNLDRAIAQALADSLVSGTVSSADAAAILNAQG